MLNYILYNNFFDAVLLILATINIAFNNTVIDINQHNKKRTKNDIVNFKKRVVNLYSCIFTFLIILISIKNHSIYAGIIVFMTVKSIYDIYINVKYNSTNLSIDNKQMYTFATFLILIFLSANSSTVYIKNLCFLSHNTKEILLLSYLIIKMMTYLFLLLINFSIFISNIKIIFNKHLAKFVPKMHLMINKKMEIKTYDFYLYKKYNTHFSLIIDKIIYIIIFPIYFTIIALLYFAISIFRFILKTILKILTTLSNFDNNRDIVIKRTLKIAIIFSLVVVYGIAIYNKHFFSYEIIEIYNLIATVILIPIVYDNIKSKI